MRAAIWFLLACGLVPTAHAEPLPPDAGAINVRDYSAKGNGRDDDTAALLKAIAASGTDTGRSFWQDRIVYFPDGVYPVSATLLKRYADGRFASGLMLMGQSQAGTILRLADHAPGFADAARPRAVVFTTSKLLDGNATSGSKDYTGQGEGNDAYMNFVEDMTIDVGHGNPGAIGIDYLANNVGAIRNVTLKAAEDSGAVGLSMTRKWPGPALIENLTVQGFGTGIATAQTEYGLTFDHIRLTDQRMIALRNNQNSLAMRDVHIRGRSPAIANVGNQGFIVLDGASLHFSGGAADRMSAFDNAGMMTIRNLRMALGDTTEDFTGTIEGRNPWQAATPPVWLPRAASEPRPQTSSPSQWANAAKYGAVADPSQDSAEGLQRAFSSGAAVVYLPHGTYAISRPLAVPPTLQRIVGMNSALKVFAKRDPHFARTGGMLTIGSAGSSVSIERLAFDNTDQGAQLAIEVSGARDVAIRDVVAAGVTLLDRKASGGRVFVSDVCCGRLQIAGTAPVFGRQIDTEGGGTRIVNDGSPLSILGLKTEGITTIVDNRAGAHTDILGGLVYMVRPSPAAPMPAFVNSHAWLSASFAEESLRPESRYSLYVADNPDGGTRAVAASEFPARGLGRFVPGLFSIPKDGERTQ
jgi:hypothetical protein